MNLKLGRPELTLFKHLLLCKNSTPQGSPVNFEFGKNKMNVKVKNKNDFGNKELRDL